MTTPRTVDALLDQITADEDGADWQMNPEPEDVAALVAFARTLQSERDKLVAALRSFISQGHHAFPDSATFDHIKEQASALLRELGEES